MDIFIRNNLGHMTKMTATHIYGKNLQNLFLQNPKSDDLETWHEAVGTRNRRQYFDE